MFSKGFPVPEAWSDVIPEAIALTLFSFLFKSIPLLNNSNHKCPECPFSPVQELIMQRTGLLSSRVLVEIVLEQERHSLHPCEAAFKDSFCMWTDIYLSWLLKCLIILLPRSRVNKFQASLAASMYSKPTNRMATSQRRLQDIKGTASWLYLQEQKDHRKYSTFYRAVSEACCELRYRLVCIFFCRRHQN